MISIEYLAGFVDGEGCIDRCGWGGNRDIPRLRISQVYGDKLMEAIESQYGGTLSRKKKRNNIKRDYYTWTITGKAATTLLKQLLPYLWVKKDKALEVLG